MKQFVTGVALVAMVAALASSAVYGQNPQGQSAPSPAKQPTDPSTQPAPSGSRQFVNDLALAGMADVPFTR